MMIYKILFLFIISLIFVNCQKSSDKPIIVATCQPVNLILQEICGNAIKIETIIGPKDSPHTFSPSPSVLKKVSTAKALFFIHDSYDKWTIKAENTKFIELISFLDKDSQYLYEDGKTLDVHFWTDPITVKKIIPQLVDVLSGLFPEKSEILKLNGEKFISNLDSVDNILQNKLTSISGKDVFLFHPSFRYFLKRYGLKYSGSIEESPGKEPTPKFIAEMIDRIKSSGTKAIFNEPQLPDNSAYVLADAAGVKLFTLDPMGGVEGRKKYIDLILFNANVLVDALK